MKNKEDPPLKGGDCLITDLEGVSDPLQNKDLKNPGLKARVSPNLMKTLYIIDASGYLYRSYFAIRQMTNDKGESTNALFGFIRCFLKLVKDFHPSHAISVFDGPRNSVKRCAIYPEYKAHRSEMPQDLVYQMEWARQFCKLFGLPMLSIPEVEADDVIGSIAVWAEQEGFEVKICSTDKDLCQLVNEKICLLDTFKENTLTGPKEVEAKFGVPPSLIRDFLALTGDASDNVPGIPGIGPKTAAELLKATGGLFDLLEHPEKAGSEKRQTLVKTHKADALTSYELVSLDLAVDVPKEDSFFEIHPTDKEALKEFYASMQFNSLLKELETHPEEAPAGVPANVNYHLVTSHEELDLLLQRLSLAKTICVDTETTSLNPRTAKLVGIGLGITPEEAWYVPFNGSLELSFLLSRFQSFFSNPELGFYGHNIKYDAHILESAGIPLKRIAFDTLIASYVLNAHNRRHSLDELSLERFKFVKTPTSALIGKGKKQITMAEVPIEQVGHYCCEDIDYTVRLHGLFKEELKERGLEAIFYDLELPLVSILMRMEATGIFLDVPTLEAVGAELKEGLAQASREVFELAGETFNLNSPQQVSRILFEKLGIPAPKGTSTSVDVLEALKWTYPIAGKIQNYRVLEKLRSTYVEVLPAAVDPHTHRIHCTFNQSVAATGRLSCNDPNLQNIPVKSEWGGKIREAFRPEMQGWSYIAADYSQIELRLLAHLSNDPGLVEAFQNGKDIHAITASKVFHVPEELVTHEMRSKAKAVNFGILYGQGAFGLSQSLGIPQKEAAEFISLYFKQYPSVKIFLESCKEQARASGKTTTLIGRERKIPEIDSKNFQIRSAAERLAVNTPFQGSAADLIKMAMLKIDAILQREHLKGKLLLQIHDELIFEVPDSEIDRFTSLIKEEMEGVMTLKIPLIVNISVGKNWREC